MKEICWKDFEKVELRVGKVLEVYEFPEARKPAYKLTVDFGSEIGIKRSSAQITEQYNPEELLGKLVVGVVNFPTKQIGPFISECLITGFNNSNNEVILCIPDKDCYPGSKLM